MPRPAHLVGLVPVPGHDTLEGALGAARSELPALRREALSRLVGEAREEVEAMAVLVAHSVWVGDRPRVIGNVGASAMHAAHVAQLGLQMAQRIRELLAEAQEEPVRLVLVG